MTGAAQHAITAAIGAVAGSAAATSAAFAAGSRGNAGLIAAAGVLTAAITVAGREWFWLRAQGRPIREMRWILKHTGSIADTERLMALLLASHGMVCDARADSGRRGRHLAQAPDVQEGRKQAGTMK